MHTQYSSDDGNQLEYTFEIMTVVESLAQNSLKIKKLTIETYYLNVQNLQPVSCQVLKFVLGT